MSQPERISLSEAKAHFAAIAKRRAGATLDQDRVDRHERQERNQIEASLRLSRVPDRLVQLACWERDEHGHPWMDTEPYLKLVRQLLSRRLIFLHGQTDTGKSAAAARVIRDRAKDTGAGAWWLTSSAYAHAYRSFDLSDKLQVRASRNASLLVLDDVGQEPDKDASVIEELLTHRYDAPGMPITICTANCDWGTFAKRYQARVVSRWREVGALVEATKRVRPR